MPDERAVRLRIGDAKLGDVGKERVRLPTKAFRVLDVRAGGLVCLEGARRIVATASLASPEDDDLDFMRLDEAQRRSLGVGIGDTITVRPFDVPTAVEIHVVTIGDAARLEPEDIRAGLGERLLRAGDMIALAIPRKQFEADVNLLGLNLVQVVGSTTDDEILVRIVMTVPPGIVQVGAGTEIVLDRGGHASGQPSRGGER